MRYFYLFLFFMILSFSAINASAGDDVKTSITIYSKATPGAVSSHLYRSGSYSYNQVPGYAVVRQERNITIDSALSNLSLTDVAAYIDPTTVSFKSLTDPENTSVVEQNFYFDLVSLQKLAERYLGKNISYEKTVKDGAKEIHSGTLLSSAGGYLVIQKDDGSITSTHLNAAIFPKLPGELYTKPTLVWDIVAKRKGVHRIESSYQTDGITWWADYNATYSEGEGANDGYLDLSAWVSIVNKSGAAYNNTKLKLIAGDVNRIDPNNRLRNARAPAMVGEMRFADAVGGVAGFKEKSFFEFHLYTLGRSTDIPDNSSKQMELFPTATKIPVEKKMVYFGASKYRPYYNNVNYNSNLGFQTNKKVDVYLKFKNDEKYDLGIPLPAGRLRVSKKDDADGSLEFIGEDVIKHTPKNEHVVLKMGSAFDVVGERKQVDFKVDHTRKFMDETFEITLRNHKDEDVEVIVKEVLYRGVNWRVFNESTPHKKIDAHTIHYTVNVPADGEFKFNYMVRYTW